MINVKPNKAYTTTANVSRIQFYDNDGEEINMENVKISGNTIISPKNAEYLDFRRKIITKLNVKQ